MAITWRNIGQSSPTGNSLIQGGTDTITSGLNTLRNVARDVSQNQIDEFNREAEVNTADLLNRIQNSDKDNLESFDINKLKSQFGNAFDATAVTEGIGDRTEELRTIARQQSQDARLDAEEIRADKQLVLAQQAAALDSLRTVSTLKVNEQNLNISKAEQTELANYSTANNYLIDNLGNYSDLNSLEQAAITKAKELKLNPANTASLVSSATSMWNTAIEPSEKDLSIINNLAATAAETNQESAKNARDKLDSEFRAKGFEPIYLNLANDTEGKPLIEVQAELSKQYDPDEVNKFITFFKDKFSKTKDGKKIPGRSPTGAEAAYFIPLAYESQWYWPNGLDINDSDFGKTIEEYRDTINNHPAVNDYKRAKTTINTAEREFGNKTLKKLDKLKKTMRDNNRHSLGQDPYDVDPRNREVNQNELDFTKLISNKLFDSNWYKGKKDNLNTSDSSDVDPRN